MIPQPHTPEIIPDYIRHQGLRGLLCLVMLCNSCLQAQVKTVFAEGVDFTRYKTYNLTDWPRDSDLLINDSDKKRVVNALISEYSRRGLTLVEEFDSGHATVAFYIVLSKEQSIMEYKAHLSSIGCEPKWGWVSGGGIKSETYNAMDYVKGTLVIDMYDADGRELVWQGVTTRILKDDPTSRDKSIPKHIKGLMKSYPVKPVK